LKRLGERDLAVLTSLQRRRLLTGDQVQRLHVPGVTAATRARRTRAVLRRLHELKLIVRLERTIGGVHAGSSGHICGLSGLGHSVLSLKGQASKRQRVWETKPPFQDHVLAVAELYVRLVEIERVGSAELLTFEGEPVCWRRFSGSNGELVTLKPDAYVRVGIGEIERSAFVEIDMGTESLPFVLGKCRTYIAYWQTAQEQQQHGVFPVVLWLVPDTKRLEQVAQVIRRLPAEAQLLFAAALQPDGPELLTAGPEGATA
jgi:hypothetical protein